MPDVEVSDADVPCAGAVVIDDQPDGARRLLLVRRGHEPASGRWSIPGGRVEAGETAEAAAVRELAEETGLVGVVVRLFGTTRLPVPGGRAYLIHDFLVDVADREPLVAADDAADARWFTLAELPGVDTTDGLLETLVEWGLADLPR